MARDGREGERGWALISVLGVLLVLSIIATGLVSLALTTKRISRTERTQLEAAAIMEAAVSRAIAGLLDPRLEQRWRVDAVPRVFKFADKDVTVTIQDELGRIDLNAADGPVLANLLRAVGGLDAAAADALADKIMDWRESDGLRHLNGATKADYLVAGKPYAPRENPFQSVDEVKLVLTMTEAVYARIAPALTVYTGRPNLDPEVAPREALLAQPGAEPARIDAALKARAAGIRSTLGPSVYATPGVIDPSIPLGGRAFTIDVAFDHRGPRTGHATIMLTGDPKRPYLAHAWTLD